MADTSPIEEVKYCFGKFHDRPLATFSDDGSYEWNRELVHECRGCEHLTPCFFISTQVKMSKDESLGGRRDHGGKDCPHKGHGHHGHHHHHAPHHGHGPGPGHGHGGHHPGSDRGPGGHGPDKRKLPRKDILDVMGDFVQMLKDTRG